MINARHRQRAGSRDCSPGRCSGFSLVEVMIALVLGLILTAGLFSIYISNRSSQRVQQTLGNIQENARFSMELIASDVRRAGFYSGNTKIGEIGGSEGASIPSAACSALNNQWGRMLEQPLYGLDDTVDGYSCITESEYLRGDVLIVRHAASTESTAFSTDRPYIRASLYAGKVFLGTDEATNTLTTFPQSTRELVAHAYYVGATGRTCDSGAAIPGLFWKTIGDDGLPSNEMLLEGVENFQVQYGIDRNGDLSVNQYLDSSVINATASISWDQVVSVRIWLLIGSGCSEAQFPKDSTFAMGDQSYQVSDSSIRNLYTTTITVRN